jgi:cupin 2 domain-containing protein
MHLKNIFHNIPIAATAEIFDPLLQHNNITIKRIVSSGQTAPESGWFDQPENEWVLVLQGMAEITFDDGSIVAMETGDFLNIPAGRKHKVTKTSDQPNTIWLAVHY